MNTQELEIFAGETAGVTPEPEANQPHSPFLQEFESLEVLEASGVKAESEHPVGIDEFETPFLLEHHHGERVADERVAEIAEIVHELQDDEFVESLVDLVDELRLFEEERFSGAVTDPRTMRAEAEQALDSYLQPLGEMLETELENLASHVDTHSVDTMSEEEFDALVDDYQPQTELENPVMDQFFRRAFRKIKRAAKRAGRSLKKLAKRAVRVAGRLLPVGVLLRRLRRLVRPLLRRVLRVAINRLPSQYRPLARRLARRFARETPESESETEDEIWLEEADEPGEDAGPDAAELEQEVDHLLAGYVAEGESFEEESLMAEYLSDEAAPDAMANLDEARAELVQALETLEEGEDPAPHIERFAPAVLTVLRIGIRVVGRRKVVNFLARYVARLIRRWTGRRAARPLSRILVDSGLRLLSLETDEPAHDENTAVAETLVATIEETFERFALEAPDEALEDEALLEVIAQEAFEEAVASNFPPDLVRNDLRESETARGTWVLMPRRSRRKRYKKYSRVLTTKLTLRTARSIRTFGDASLASFLRDQLGVRLDRGPVQARVHLYEAIRGSTLSHIAYHERRTPGLGSGRRHAWSQIHALTPQAAALLLGPDAGLGRRVAARFLHSRHRISIRQRFYFLEIEGASVRRRRPTATRPSGGGASTSPPPTAPRRMSDVNVTIHTSSGRLRVAQFLSEDDARGVRDAGSSVGAVLRTVRSGLSAVRRILKSGRGSRKVRIVQEVSTEQLLPAVVVSWALGYLASKVADAILAWLTKYLRSRMTEFRREFAAAVDNSEDGVTLVYTIRGQVIADLFSPSVLTRTAALARVLSGSLGAISISIRPGFTR